MALAVPGSAGPVSVVARMSACRGPTMTAWGAHPRTCESLVSRPVRQQEEVVGAELISRAGPSRHYVL